MPELAAAQREAAAVAACRALAERGIRAVPVPSPPPPRPGSACSAADAAAAAAAAADALPCVQPDGGGPPLFAPPLFGVVEPGLYRSGFPLPATFPFLAALRVATVVNLLDRLPSSYAAWLAGAGARYVHAPVKGNKAHCEEMDRRVVRRALALLARADAAPALVHCRSGKHRTGAFVGCVRMLQVTPGGAWDLEGACGEYVRYCGHKQRTVDKQYIERFDPRTLAPLLERGATPLDGGAGAAGADGDGNDGDGARGEGARGEGARGEGARGAAPARAAWLPEGALSRPSALQAAVETGFLSPAEAAARGLRVAAIETGPDEPGFPAAEGGAADGAPPSAEGGAAPGAPPPWSGGSGSGSGGPLRRPPSAAAQGGANSPRGSAGGGAGGGSIGSREPREPREPPRADAEGAGERRAGTPEGGANACGGGAAGAGAGAEGARGDAGDAYPQLLAPGRPLAPTRLFPGAWRISVLAPDDAEAALVRVTGEEGEDGGGVGGCGGGGDGDGLRGVSGGARGGERDAREVEYSLDSLR